MNKSLSSALGGLLVGCLCIGLFYFYQQQEEQSLIRTILEDEKQSEKYFKETFERAASRSDSSRVVVAVLPELDVTGILGLSNRAKMENLSKTVVASYDEATRIGDYEKLLSDIGSAVKEIKAEYKKVTGKEMHSYLDTTSLEKQADQALTDRLITSDEYANYLASLISAAEVEYMLIAE